MDLPALAFLAAVLAVKEAGLPIPVPGDLLVIGAGAAAAHGSVPAPVVVVVLVAATIVGGLVQFWLLRGRARTAFVRVLGRFGLRAETVERGTGRLRDGGAPAVAIARMTPGVRIVTIASSAIAGIATTSFVLGLATGNAVFLTGHFVLGLVVGPTAVGLVSGAGPALVAAGLALAALGAAGWWLIARRRAGAPATVGTGPTEGRLAILDWTDACCPACLALAVGASGREREAA
jgi:membrane protein DedA with SNARE-associated domain